MTLLRAAFGILIAIAVAAHANAAPVPREKPPEPLPTDIVAAWKSRGQSRLVQYQRQRSY